MNMSESSLSGSNDDVLISQLRQSLGLLQVAFDAASEAMVIVDSDWRVRWANQASADLLIGGVPIQLVNQILPSILKLRPADARPQQLFEILDPHKPLPRIAGESRCYVMSGSEGETTLQQIRWQPVCLIDTPFLLITIRDLSAEERALLQQQRFMTNLTHELRTPLAIVTGNLRRMSRLKDLSGALSAHLEMAQEEIGRIQMLLGDLALITQLEVDTGVL